MGLPSRPAESRQQAPMLPVLRVQGGPEGTVPWELSREVDKGAAEEPQHQPPLLQQVPDLGRGHGDGQGQGEIRQRMFQCGKRTNSVASRPRSPLHLLSCD